MRIRWRLPFTALLLASAPVLQPGTGLAQAFTNSAVLTAALDGTRTNLVITYTMSTTQGWVTLFSADTPQHLATNAKPFDLVQVPPSQQGQFIVPMTPGAPVQFFRLLLEQWPSRAKALVWTNSPIDFT